MLTMAPGPLWLSPTVTETATVSCTGFFKNRFPGFTGVWQQWSDASERVEGQGTAVLRTRPSRMPPPPGAELLGQPDPLTSLQMGVIFRWITRLSLAASGVRAASGRTYAADYPPALCQCHTSLTLTAASCKSAKGMGRVPRKLLQQIDSTRDELLQTEMPSIYFGC